MSRSYARISSNREMEIIDIAERKLYEAGVDRFPIDLDLVARYLNVFVHYQELDDDVSGFLVVDNSTATAVINNSHHSNRQRFTVAHEIGHFCLHVENIHAESLFIDKQFPVHRRDNKSSLGTLKKEVEANLFASILLMPEELISEEVDELDIDFFDDEDIRYLAGKIGVSQQALIYRLARLNYEVDN